MITLDRRRLTAGSREAAAVYALMGAQRIVHLDCAVTDRLDAALTVAAVMLRAKPTARITFAANSRDDASRMAAAVLPALPRLGEAFATVITRPGGVLARGRLFPKIERLDRVPTGASALHFQSALSKTFRLTRVPLPCSDLLVLGLQDRPWRGLPGAMSWLEAEHSQATLQSAKISLFGRQLLIVGPSQTWHDQLHKLVAGSWRGDHEPWGPVPLEVMLSAPPDTD